MPNALAMGIDYKLFWHLNPAKMEPFYEAYKLRVKNELSDSEMSAYMNGIYVAKAIGSRFGKEKYPQKPIGLFSESKDSEEKLTEEQIKIEREKLIMSLQIMQTNFELNHKN